jgi:hypothetical protein
MVFARMRSGVLAGAKRLVDAVDRDGLPNAFTVDVKSRNRSTYRRPSHSARHLRMVDGVGSGRWGDKARERFGFAQRRNHGHHPGELICGNPGRIGALWLHLYLEVVDPTAA